MRAVFRPEVAGRRACSSRSVRRCRENRCFHRRALLQGPCVFAFQMDATWRGAFNPMRICTTAARAGLPRRERAGMRAAGPKPSGGFIRRYANFRPLRRTGGIWQDSRAGCNKTLAVPLRTMRVRTGMLPGLPEPPGEKRAGANGGGAENVAVGAGVPRHSRAVFGNFLLDSAARAC